MTTLLAQLKALADDTRLRLVGLLLDRELSVGEIALAMGMSQPRISRHLKVLADAGLLAARREGLWALYSAAQAPDRAVLEGLDGLLRAEPAIVADAERFQQFLAERRGETRRFFNDLAPRWSGLSHGLLGGTDLVGEIDRRLPACAVMADLGCGDGELLAVLAGRPAPPRLIGVDASPAMLEAARQRLGEAASLRLGELEHLPLSDAEADCAVLSMTLHHLVEPLAGLQEARRALGPGGRLILADLARHEDESLRARLGDRWLGFDEAQLEGWLRQAGFAVVARDRLPLQPPLAALLFTAAAAP